MSDSLVTDKLVISKYYGGHERRRTYDFRDVESNKTLTISEDKLIQLIRSIDLLARGE